MKRDPAYNHRNREPILAVLRDTLPAGLVLEIGSGAGQHARWFSEALPGVTWQPTDRDPEALASIEAWRADGGTPNLRAPLRLDVEAPWPVAAADAVLAINVVHASSWPAARALLAGAGRVLSAGGPVVLYGAWREGGVTAPSNEAFDGWLKERDPAWGVRDVEAVAEEADRHGLALERVVEMPANNRIVILRRR